MLSTRLTPCAMGHKCPYWLFPSQIFKCVCVVDSQSRKKVALITGASGGIGKAFAEILSAEDYDLVLVARSGDELNRIAGIEMSRNQTGVTAIPLDLSLPQSADELVKELASRNIVPDIVINNAGVGMVGALADLPAERQLNMIDLNVRALTAITMAVVPDMVARNDGGIINVSSVAAFTPGPYMSVYYASKAFVQSFSDGLAHELKDSKVRVMTLCPGPVDTQFQATAGLDTSRWVYKMMMPKTPQEVAQAGWAGFKAGNKRVYPGLFDMLAAWSSRILPQPVMLAMVRFFQKPKQS